MSAPSLVSPHAFALRRSVIVCCSAISVLACSGSDATPLDDVSGVGGASTNEGGTGSSAAGNTAMSGGTKGVGGATVGGTTSSARAGVAGTTSVGGEGAGGTTSVGGTSATGGS